MEPTTGVAIAIVVVVGMMGMFQMMALASSCNPSPMGILLRPIKQCWPRPLLAYMAPTLICLLILTVTMLLAW